MKDFSVLWAGDHVSIVSPDGAPYEALYEKDLVQVIPVDVQTAEIIIRREVCPPYTIKDKSEHSHFLTIVSGGVEENESSEEAAVREVREELGIDLESADYELFRLTPESIPYMKGTAGRVSLFALMLFDYTQATPAGDGTPYEELSTFERVPLQQIEDMLTTDQADFLLHAAVAKLKCMLLS